MVTKTCSKCMATFTETEFYSGSAQCKACVRTRAKAYRAANIDAVREYDRARSTLPHRIENATRVTREWRRKHRDRQAAHNKANRSEAMVAPETCEGCGRSERLEKHHHDYSKPLLVTWLCKPCHAIADKLRRLLEAS